MLPILFASFFAKVRFAVASLSPFLEDGLMYRKIHKNLTCCYLPPYSAGQATMYEIHYHNHTCKKMPLKVAFHPLAIPKDATLLGEAIVGSSSGPGQGLLVNTWIGDLPDKSGEKASYWNFHLGNSFIQPIYGDCFFFVCPSRKVHLSGH